MTLRRLPLLAALGLFAVAGPVRADDDRGAVRDEAGLFSPAARRKADDEIRAFRQEIEKTHPNLRPPEVVVETAASAPDDLRKQAAAVKASQAALFQAWAEKRAEAADVDGVYVLICADPGDVEVVVRPDAEQAAFTAYDAKRLRNALKSMRAGPRHEGQRDKKLLSAVARIGDDLRYNLRPPFPWLPVGGVLAGAFGLCGVLALVRRRLRVVPAAAGSPPLFAALLGGMFGTAAGHWVYDPLFVAASRTAVPVTEDVPIPVEAPPAPDGDADYAPTAAERLDLAAREESGSPAPTRS